MPLVVMSVPIISGLFPPLTPQLTLEPLYNKIYSSLGPGVSVILYTGSLNSVFTIESGHCTSRP